MLKGPSGNRFVLKGGDAQSGKLITMWDGARPNTYSPMKKQGCIVLGTGGDGSNGGTGTFFEGAITSGLPSDAVDDAIQANINAAGYGSTTTSAQWHPNQASNPVSPFKVHHNPLTGKAVIAFTLQNTDRITLTLLDLSGRHVAAIADVTQSAGKREAALDVKGIPPGIYIVSMRTDRGPALAGRIAIGR
jgi:hypothetical protein